MLVVIFFFSFFLVFFFCFLFFGGGRGGKGRGRDSVWLRGSEALEVMKGRGGCTLKGCGEEGWRLLGFWEIGGVGRLCVDMADW